MPRKVFPHSLLIGLLGARNFPCVHVNVTRHSRLKIVRFQVFWPLICHGSTLGLSSWAVKEVPVQIATNPCQTSCRRARIALSNRQCAESESAGGGSR